MEFGLREWMILISGLLIIVVIVDGVRRMLADRRHHIRMDMSYHDGEEEVDYFEDNPELPNGGARTLQTRSADINEPVIGSLNIEDEAPLRERFGAAAVPAADTLADRYRPEYPAQEAMSAERPPESLEMESVSADSYVAEQPVRTRRKMPSFKRTPPTDEVLTEVEPELSGSTTLSSSPPLAATSLDTEPALALSEDLLEEQPVSKSAEAVEESPQAIKPASKDQPDEVLVINVVARDKNGFNGSDLLEVLLACDVRFGEMNIFHRYEGAKGNGPIQFSVANLVKPGTFDLSTMEEFYTPGITFFMQLPGPADPLAAFDCMAEIASCMVRNLQGEMRDEGHSVLTQQTLEHYRERIGNFERMRLMRANRKA